MSEIDRIVVVGAGLAGATAAATLRESGYTGELTLFGNEPHPPYELPPLSKAIMLGERDEPDWVREDGFYAAHDIDLRRESPVAEVRPDEHVVVDGAGSKHGYDRLLLATGSRPRRIPTPAAEGDIERVPGLHYLRTLDDALALRGALVPGARLAIVGAGWIGCEVAAAARAHGVHVTMVDPLPSPLYSVLGDEIGAVFRDLHAEHGVDLQLSSEVAGILAQPGEGVRGLRMRDGSELKADAVLVGIGAVPRVELARHAGLDLTESGVAADSGLRTSAPDVYAAGDIAAHDHPRYPGRVRVEHWANAQGQGEHVAGNLLGGTDPYEATPFFFSDQYDLGCEYRGLADPHNDRLVVRGDVASREFVAFWLRGGRVAAAMNVNAWDDGDALQALVDSGAEVAPEALTSANLSSLV